jgi:hypothetical protein
MRGIPFLVTVLLVIFSSAVLAQQSPGLTTDDKPLGDKIGHPPPLPGPPPIPQSSLTALPAPAASTSGEKEPAPKGYTGAYAPAGTPPTPYSTGPLPQSSGGPGLSTVAPDGVSTRTVKAVPCGAVARETDGFTTCVGIMDQGSSPSPRMQRLHRSRR